MESASIGAHDPRPARASCGFLLYAGSWIGFAAWLAWAYVPDRVLHAWGVTWYPSKYWALAIPVAIVVAFVLGLTFWVGYTIATIQVEPYEEAEPGDSQPPGDEHPA